jgi:hypothetical protein
VLVSLILVWRTKNFYRGDIYAKFKVAATATDGSSDGGAVEMAKGTEEKRKKQVASEELY